MIDRERRRLKRAFRVALLAASGPAVILACSGSDDADDGEAGLPFNFFPDAAVVRKDAAVDSGRHDAGPTEADGAMCPPVTFDAALPLDGFASGGCYITAIELDSGPQAAALGLDTCLLYYGCGLPSGVQTVGCNVLYVAPTQCGGTQLIPIPGMTCTILEDAGCSDGVFTPSEAGAYTMSCYPCASGGGRRTAGLVARSRPCASAHGSRAGAYLAAMAFEEEASIAAFARMRAELVDMGAPRTLVEGAARALRDETRHARVMSRLAKALGTEPPKALVRSVGKRSAATIAAENAAEGCVRETYGALVLAWQAQHAGDRDLRRVFTHIARDEARHAALSWALATWLDTRLDTKGRARVSRAKAKAIARLVSELAAAPTSSVLREAGVPTKAEASALLASMTRELGLPSATTTARRRSRRS